MVSLHERKHRFEKYRLYLLDSVLLLLLITRPESSKQRGTVNVLRLQRRNSIQ